MFQQAKSSTFEIQSLMMKTVPYIDHAVYH